MGGQGAVMKGWLWCEVCKAWRYVNVAQGGRPYCHRCDWDMGATIVTRVDTYRHWKHKEGWDC